VPNIQMLKFIFAGLIGIALSSTVFAINLGKANLVSRPGETLRVEVPIELGADEQALLSSLSASIPPALTYERLGVSPKILDFNTQVMVYRSKDERLMILIETVKPIPVSEDVFIDLLLTLNWSTGSISRVYTFLNSNFPKFLVEPGQTLSSIASQMGAGSPDFSLDQKMMALYQANPDAFISGNINQLLAGSELLIPNAAAIQAIDSKDAQKFVDIAAQQWRERKKNDASVVVSADESSNPSNLLKIGSSGDKDADTKRITEEIVAQEKILEKTNTRVAELEKNISVLKKLLGETEGASQTIDADKRELNLKTTLLGLASFLLITALLIWFFMRNSRQQQLTGIQPSNYPSQDSPLESAELAHHNSHHEGISNKAKALFGGINLDLPPAKSPVSGVSSDELRVKLNLARAYITIEDFSAATKSLDEVVRIGASIDPEIVIEAQGMLAELSHRNG
jgi:pilus assembly protein FimV